MPLAPPYPSLASCFLSNVPIHLLFELPRVSAEVRKPLWTSFFLSAELETGSGDKLGQLQGPRAPSPHKTRSFLEPSAS